MPALTNLLRGKARRFVVPSGILALILFTSAFVVNQKTVEAASESAPTMSKSSVSSLVAVDRAVEAVAARVTPSVVNISVTSKTSTKNISSGSTPNFGFPQNELPREFQWFFGQQGNGQGYMPKTQIEHGVGSGFIISPDGYIVTNYHVVDGATQMRVTLNDRRVFTAKLVGVDKLNDIAVIKINAKNLPSVAWGNSTKLRPGETVLAFGSPFGYFHFSVTRGIVSAVDRPNPYSNNPRRPGDFIQTDAAINPGNSGGPLVDAYGQVVGINTFIITNDGSFAGAGFAIPSQIARVSAEEIIKYGTVHHGYLGIGMNNVTPENASFFNLHDASGAIVSQVTPDSPASRAGLQRGDVLREINGKKIANGSALQVAVTETKPGTVITLGILRNGKPETLKVTVGEYHGSGKNAGNGNGGSQGHGRLGVAISNLTPKVRQQLNVPLSVHGVAIESVKAGSPADDAGLVTGEVIMEMNRKPVQNVEQLANEIQAVPAGKDILLLVWSKEGTSYRVVHLR